MKTILIVDDKPENIYMLEALLKAKKFKTISAEDGAKALELARKKVPDIIISDILMPGMDGFTLCMHWKKDPVLKEIPFVFYTATYTDPKDAEFALNLGADRFIIKPMEPEDFIKIIEELLADWKTDKPPVKKPKDIKEEVLLKEYNSVLIRKLEDKLVYAEISDKKLRRYTLELEKNLEKIRQSEKKLAQSEELYKNLFNEDLTGNYIKTLDGTILLCNLSFARIFGFETVSAAIGFNMRNLYSDLANRELFIKEIKRKGKAEHYGIWMKKVNGQAIHIIENAIGTFNSKREITEIKGYIFENTSLVMAEKQLKKLSLAIEQNPASIIITDKEGNIEYVNPKFTELTGYELGEIIGKNPRILKSGATTNQEYKKLWKAISSGNNWYGEFQNVKKDGGIYYEIAAISPIMDESGNITNYLAVKKDITEQKITEEALRKSEDKYRKIFENVQDVFYQVDMQGLITDISPSITRLAGYKPEELIGKPVATFYFEPKDREKYIEQLVRKGEVWDYEMRLLLKSGDMKYASINSHLNFDQDNKPVGIEGSIRDISERKEYEAKLILAKEKAEESDSLKTAFLNNISHEIRTPLNSIVGFSSLLGDPLSSPDNRAYFSDIISKSSEQLLSIITDIINIATIEAGQEKLNEKEFNINAIFRLIKEQFLAKANELNIEFKFVTPLPDKEVTIISDETKLIQVITNIVNNAFKFTVKGFIYFGYNIKGNTIEFYVEDSGIGIDSNMHEEIFKRFRQVESNATRKYGGSGLGLSISKAYVELLGGKIWVDSEPGKGSVFYFTIPFNKTKQDNTLPKNTNHNHKVGSEKQATILIAEDEDYNFMYIEALLSEKNIAIIRAKNGLEAVELYKSNPQVDLILMDIKMPIMNGYEATRQIKEYKADTIVIAQTAYSTEADRNRALESGCSDFISKPFTREMLLNKINEHILR